MTRRVDDMVGRRPARGAPSVHVIGLRCSISPNGSDHAPNGCLSRRDRPDELVVDHPYVMSPQNSWRSSWRPRTCVTPSGQSTTLRVIASRSPSAIRSSPSLTSCDEAALRPCTCSNVRHGRPPGTVDDFVTRSSCAAPTWLRNVDDVAERVKQYELHRR